MATNTAALKTFAQQTRLKLLSLIKTKLEFVLTQDTAELRGYEAQIAKLKTQIQTKGKDIVVEEVAYTWFNRVMALRYMDANGYTTPMVVTPAPGQMRPEVLQEAMSGSVDENLRITAEDLNLPEAKLYRKLLVATCNHWGATMPFLFEHISDYTELLLPEDLLSEQSFVSDIRRGMTDEDCQNVEVMGWLYQFYITDRKTDAEVKKTKKGGLKSDEQAAATQLFTPHWVVRYMVENSLGRTWMTLHPDSRLVEDMSYYIPTPEGQTDTIPEDIHSAADIKFIDPCMGSGHVLVYAFDLFCKMYEEEGYQTREIPALILTNNIYGIDIDPRCQQLASFALTMKARAYHSRYLRKAVVPNAIALQAIDRDVIASTGAWSSKSTMWQFENVDTIGSLLQIDPKECVKIQVESGLFGEHQQLLKKQAEYLSQKYHCVVTNPPYLGKGFCDVLKLYINEYYEEGKADLCTCFTLRQGEFTSKDGYYANIIPPSWMFLSTFEQLRISIIEKQTIKSLLHLSRGVFGADFGSVTYVIQNKTADNACGTYFRLVERTFQEFDQKHLRLLFEKTLSNHDFRYCFGDYTKDITDIVYNEKGSKIYFSNVSQNNFRKIPSSPIVYWVNDNVQDIFNDNLKLSDYASAKNGMTTGDNNTFLRLWHEVDAYKVSFQGKINSAKKWYSYNKGGYPRKWYGNLENLINWENNGKAIRNYKKSILRNPNYYFKPSISWSLLSSSSIGSCFRYNPKAELFDVNGMSLFTNDNIDPYKILGLLNSKVAKILFNLINPTMALQCGDVLNMPCIINSVENITKLCVATSKLDWDAHETSWDFQENELIRLVNKQIRETGASNFPLEAVMMVYQAEWNDKFKQLHANEEELNRQFIEIYGLQDELTPDVPLDEVTILQKGEISIEDGEIVWHEDVVIKQLISYLVGCFMGRYSIDKPGLIIASQNQDLTTLGVKVEGIDNGAEGRLEIDDDGVVPILAGEYFPDDMTVRIEQAIKTIFGEQHFHANLNYINEKLGKPLREYLFKDFYNDHIDGKMYQKRPIYWMFSSKLGDKRKKGYFKALVYMHRIESDTLSKLHADYVVPYIDKIEQQHLEAEDLAMRDDISQAQRNKARKSADEYADQIRELKDFEQVLVQMASQRLSIDLDDGVRTNYPKFYPLVEPIKGLDKE